MSWLVGMRCHRNCVHFKRVFVARSCGDHVAVTINAPFRHAYAAFVNYRDAALVRGKSKPLDIE